MKSVIDAPKSFMLFFIRIYQKTLSFDHGWTRGLYPNGFCRFYPTCSEYGFKSINQYGLIRGSALTAWRILRCNPFSKGGIDEPPEM
jgi:uncharacterized protein